MNPGFPSYADRCDDYSPDSGFDSAYSSMFGSTGSRLGSSQDVEIRSGSKLGDFIHGKSPSWPVTQVMAKPSPGHAFPSSRSTSWPGQMKTENDMRFNSTKSFFGVTGEQHRDRVSDVMCPGNRTDNSWCDLVSHATHKEETLSPESARRIFREATARNERIRSDRYSTSFLHSTPEKPHKVFLHPSPSVVDKSYAVSKASGYNSLYGGSMGSCSSSSLKELNDLASCRKRITLPREHTSSYETFNCPQGIQKPDRNEVDALSTRGAMGLRNQVCHGTRSHTDWQNNSTSHRISGACLDHEVPYGLNGKHNNPSCDLSKLATPVQLQRQGSDWNEMQVRSDHSPGASPRGLIVARAAQSGHNDALILTLRSPNEGACPTLTISESLPKTCSDPDRSGGIESKQVSCSGTPVVQQLERLSLSRTSMLRKLSHEFFGQSATHSPGMANHAILGNKRYRRFGSVDEAGEQVTDNNETSPFPYSTPDSGRCQTETDSRNRFLKPCQNGNGVSPSGDPEDFTAVSVIPTGVSPTTGCYLPSVPEMNLGPVDGEDVGASYPLETHFHKPKPDQRFEKIAPVSFDDRNVAVVVPLDSPPPPDLPPRKYRESGNVNSKLIGTDVQGHGLDLLGANDDDDNSDSAAAAGDYAEQLRRQAKRLSHSHSSIFTSTHSPKVEQVAFPSGQVRRLVDHANQENNSSKSTGFVITSIHSPRVKLQSGTSPNASHCEVVPNVRHGVMVPSGSGDTCSTALTVNGSNESLGTGKVHEGVAIKKTGKTSCSKNLFDSNTRPDEKSSISGWIISVGEVKNSDLERNSVNYVRSLSSPENRGLGPKVNDSRNEETSLIMERKIYKEKNSSGKRNHLGHEGNSSVLEGTSLSNDRIDSREDRKFSNKESNSVSHERNSSSHERNSSSHERKSLSHERNSPSHERNSSNQERKSAPQERKSVSQERNTLSCRGNRSGLEEHTSNRGRKNLNEERGGINCQRDHSNEERQILSQERNRSSKERHRQNTNKNVNSNEDRSLSHERKSEDSERYSIIKTRKDLNHELHTATYGNDINGMGQVEKCGNPEKSPSHKSSGIKRTGLNLLGDEVPSGCSLKSKDVKLDQKITDFGCDTSQHDSEDRRSELNSKCRPACDESVKNLEKNVEKKTAPPNTSKREFSDTGNHIDSPIVHSPRNKNKEKICKTENAANTAEPHWDCNFKEETPMVKVTEAKLVISTSSDAVSIVTKPLNSIIKMVSAKKMKPGNPISVHDSDVSMAKTKLVHSSLEGNAVIREKPVVNDANQKPVNVVCENDSAVKVSALLNSRCGTALAKIQGDFNPSSSHVQEEIPSFLSDVLPKEQNTATCYLARLSFNNILTKNVEHGTCLPAVRASIQPYLRYLTEKAVASSSSCENQESSSVHSKLKQVSDMDELLVLRKIDGKLKDKLKDFEKEKLSIENEVIENVALGHKLTSLAEEKLEPKEFGKYRLYVDEMDKVLCLLLNVTKRLSSVETSIKSLPADGSTNERSVLVSKRDDLSQKYEDALALSEGIALRRHQVADYLVKCLSGGELKSFEHFVEAKLRLFLEKQAVEDIITIIQSKLQLLNSDGAFD